MAEGLLRAPVFVTGGSGYLGRNLIRALRLKGVLVRALARTERAESMVERLGAEAVSGDLSDIAALRRGMEGAGAVLHSAAYLEVSGPPEVFHAVNVVGTQHVLDAAREAGVGRVLHVSTEAVLADGDPIVFADESRPIPATLLPGYPASKAEAERRVVEAGKKGLSVVIIRPRFIWGRDDTTLLPALVEAVRTGRFAWISGGHYLTSTCHVANVCHGALLALERGTDGGIYFLTDGEPVEAREFLTALLRTRGIDPGSRSVPRWIARAVASLVERGTELFAKGSVPPLSRSAVSLIGQEVTVRDGRARRELGYAPILSRAEGLEELVTGRWKE